MAASDPPAPHQPISRKSLAVAAFSTIVEWYDFTLYLYFATVLARLFYGGTSEALSFTLGSFALAYLMRPLGAVVFGHVGDRHGRRSMLLWSVALMTAAMLVTALLPTKAEIGVAAGWALFLLRCVMGFSVGGEYSGVVAYLLEGARAERRGLVASLASAASEIGALLAVAVSALTVASMSEADLASWGWRIPFFVGAALAGSVWIARSSMQESPEFERQVTAGSVPESPWRHAFANHKLGIFRAFSISALGSITYYVGITYVPAFLTTAGRLSEADSLWLGTAAAVAVILVTPLTGILSDRVGRKPVLVAVALLSAVLPITLFSLMGGGSHGQALVGALVLACVAGAMSAVGAVATAEQFPGEGRVTGLAFGATGATAIFGGLTPWLAERLVATTGQATMPGIMIAVVAVAVLPVFLTLKETAPARSG
ncbi:MHS family proline/betaine transporter-like MFS transporter [Sphingomonas kaistensis]|uniref:MHS family proline/betaine transporter-like MFS transporter n=1 Tax=Sphingomonas kaistensis TaxID=298708 RepID=A0A7X5Y4Y1_9SPHN|nr:MFS transporter [Sphingomonas kaistensis]NJC05279.1 MHS family proline/betaine transporter-like MFS transporter [Sphingomonas kaistensis]